jgi:hypothetical protein
LAYPAVWYDVFVMNRALLIWTVVITWNLIAGIVLWFTTPDGLMLCRLGYVASGSDFFMFLWPFVGMPWYLPPALILPEFIRDKEARKKHRMALVLHGILFVPIASVVVMSIQSSICGQ